MERYPEVPISTVQPVFSSGLAICATINNNLKTLVLNHIKMYALLVYIHSLELFFCSDKSQENSSTQNAFI